MAWTDAQIAVFHEIRDSCGAYAKQEVIKDKETMAGLIATGDLAEFGDRVTLVSSVAASLGLTLLNCHVKINGKKRDVLRWLPIGTPEPPMLPNPNKRIILETDGDIRLSGYAARPDDGPFSRPVHFLGMIQGWVNEAAAEEALPKKQRGKAKCQVCGGLELDPTSYCLKCDRTLSARKLRLRSRRSA